MYGGCLGRLAAERPSPVEVLAANGYTTAGFSTNPHLSKSTGYDRGFHYFEDFVPDEVDPYLSRIKGGQRLLRQPLTHYLLAPFSKPMRPAQAYTSAAAVTDRVCGWLDSVELPFFTWIHYMDVHWPYHLESRLSHPREVAQAWRDRATMYRRASFKRDKSITPVQRDRFIQLYEEALQYLDAQIGRLLRHLDRLGHGSNTIIVVASDHGEEFLDHGRWGHWESNLYDEIVKVPLLMRIPGQAEGEVVEHQVRLLDVMPTVLDLCGYSPPSGVEGNSMAPLWSSNGTGYEVTEAITEMWRPPWHRIAVRTEAFKYIWDNKRPDQPELYDLRSDPGETQNVTQYHTQLAHRFQTSVQRYLQRINETKSVAESLGIELDRETVQRLRALGYIE
jgi:arylsulfatase A-like enzyme